MNFKQLIKQNYLFLLKSLDPSHEFFGGLQLSEAIQHQVAYINEQSATPGDKTYALLSALLRVDDDLQDSLMDDVIEALRSSGQGHIANIFRIVSDRVSMSDEHYHQLQTKTAELSKYVDPENALLNRLLSAKVISLSEVERIRFAAGRNEMARKLIEMLMRKPDDAFETLVETLNEVGQSHVSYILTGEGNARPLSQKLRDKLISNRVKLIGSIYFKGLVSVLMSRGVFTEHDQQHVESRPTENEKIERTLDLIARKSQSAFYQFLVALVETRQEHVVVEMMGSEIAAKVDLITDTDAAGFCTANLEIELRQIMQDAFEKDENGAKDLNDVLDKSETSFTGVEEGSIIVKFRCKNVGALQELHRSQKLDELFTRTFCSPLVHKGLKSIRLQIEDHQFQQCADKFMALKLMTSEHREALVSSTKFLVNKVTVSGDLLEKLPLSEEHRQAIEEAATGEDKVKMLLDVVSRQPDTSFEQLLSALRDTKQEQSALILCPSLLDLRDEETLLPQPATALKTAENSMRHLIANLPAIDNETKLAISNLRTSLSTMRQNASRKPTNVERTQRDKANMARPETIDACQNCNSVRMTEATGNDRITLMQPMPVPNSAHTSSHGDKPFVTVNRKSAKV